ASAGALTTSLARRAPARAGAPARPWLAAGGHGGGATTWRHVAARRIRCATRFATTATTEAMGRLQFQEHGWVPVSGCDPMSRGAQGPGGPSPPGGPGVSCCAHVAATVAAVAALAVAAAVFARAYGWDGRQVWFLAT
ncbi:unnamed protein product, partial [Prorocentrum cordatum]